MPDDLEKLRLPILVLKIVGVLPRIDDQQWDARLSEIGLMIVDLRNQQSFSDRFPNQRRPTGPHDARRNFVQLVPKRLKSAEILLNGPGKNPIRRATAFWRQVLPEDRMQNVSGQVESQCAF